MLIDIYALAPERSAAMVERFLARFLPHRVRAEANYSVQIGSDDTVAVFDTPEELAAFCEAEPMADARAYWTSESSGDPQSGHVFFLPDGGLVLGLSVATCEKAEWDRWMIELRQFSGAAFAYWIGESPPEGSMERFLAVAQRHAEPGVGADSR